MTKKQLKIFLLNEVSDFLEELVDGTLDSYNIMDKAKKLLKEIKWTKDTK